MKPANLNDVIEECRNFPELFQSLYLATCSAAAEPEASYAPYVKLDDNYYIYVSELSAHTANLAETQRCSVLFIENEMGAKHLFSRRRLTLQCDAIECGRESEKFESLMEKFVEKFGDFMSMIRNLTDFHLYQLHPKQGVYVAGFAQAYSLTGEGLREITHQKR